MLLRLSLPKGRETFLEYMMVWKSLSLRIFSVWLAFAPIFGFAQIRGRANAMAGIDGAGNAQTIEAALHLMADQAAIIFVGTVATVERNSNTGGFVEIHFTVDQPIRGCSVGDYILREWAGLWTANDSRYRVGQRLLLFLHAPGPSGLSSPVGGLDGAIPVRAAGGAISRSSTTTSAAEPVADLRWLGAKLVRTVTYRSAGTSGAIAPRAMATRADLPTANTASTLPGDSSTPDQQSAVTTVVSMIRSWEVATDATR